MAPYKLSLLLIILPAALPAALSQSPQYSSPPPSPPLPGYDMYTSIIIVAVIVIFFALAFFSLYIGRFTTTSTPIDSSSPSPPPAKLGLDPHVLASFPTLLYSDVKHHWTAPLDCAVCLCEFEEEETLRLLPKCNHAFHPDCIGMWLHSHVTCPVCRADLEEKDEVGQEGKEDDVVVEVWGEGERERFTLRVPERKLRRWATMEAPKAVGENEKGLGAVGRGARSERWTAARRTWSIGGEEETPVEIVCMA